MAEPMITHVVQAYCSGLGWVDSRTAGSEQSAASEAAALKADNNAWMPSHHGPNPEPRRVRVVPVADSNCAEAYRMRNRSEHYADHH